MNRYKIHYAQQLGSGNYATVYKGTNVMNNTPVAIKVFNKTQILMDQVKRKSMRAEFKAIQIKCQNILDYIELAQCQNNYYMIMQQCEFDLRKIINNITQRQAIEYFKQIVNGLRHLVEKNIAHRDLKPQNILVKKSIIKIGDFGSSTTLLHPSIELQEVAGSIIYMSPEALKGQRYSSSCDIWSIGVLFYELLHGKTPWYTQGDNKTTLLEKIKKFKVEFRQQICQKSKNLILKCLEINRHKRINWDNFLADEIFGDQFYDYFVFQDALNAEIRFFLKEFNKKLSNNGIMCSKFFETVYPNKTQIEVINFKKIVKWVNIKINRFAVYKLFQKLDLNHNGFASIQILSRLCTALKQQQEDTGKYQMLGLKKNYSAPQSTNINTYDFGRNSIIKEFHGAEQIEFSNIIENIEATVTIKKLQSQFKKTCSYSKFMNSIQFVSFMKKLCPQLSSVKINLVFNHIKQEDKNIWFDSLSKMGKAKKYLEDLSMRENCSTISVETSQNSEVNVKDKKQVPMKKKRIFCHQN